MVFATVCELMMPVLAGPARAEIVAAAARSPRMSDALAALAEGVRAHAFHTSQGAIRFAKLIDRYDGLTRAEGLHAMHEWDGVSDRVNLDTIPLDVLHDIAELRRNDATDDRVLAILLDYYFLHVLALLALRAWDDGDADANLDRLGELLASLQGPAGSGHRFADNAETLLLIATCRYEKDERGFDLLLDRVCTLSRAHQVQVALGHAASIGCHLRFGFAAIYGKDAALMRHENAADYPWLRFSLLTLLRAFDEGATGPSRGAIVEALLGGLTADAAHFMADPDIAAGCDRHHAELLSAFEIYRPAVSGYSPLAFFFESSHSVLRGAVIDAMLWGEPWPVTLNDLLTSRTNATPDAARLSQRVTLATTLMDSARKNPRRIRGKLMPVIVYDPATGRRELATALRAFESR